MFRGTFLGEEIAVKRLDGHGLQGLPNFLREVQVREALRSFTWVRRPDPTCEQPSFFYYILTVALWFVDLQWQASSQ